MTSRGVPAAGSSAADPPWRQGLPRPDSARASPTDGLVGLRPTEGLSGPPDKHPPPAGGETDPIVRRHFHSGCAMAMAADAVLGRSGGPLSARPAQGDSDSDSAGAARACSSNAAPAPAAPLPSAFFASNSATAVAVAATTATAATDAMAATAATAAGPLDRTRDVAVDGAAWAGRSGHQSKSQKRAWLEEDRIAGDGTGESMGRALV
mmetsp:Transcript_52142/g.108851  ORF Transcript_52142/g.108851 Transcript_52142/m.108851 type:complete len:208 (-) Transcript_52142:117-740(-)